MARILKCGDLFPGCDAVVNAETDEEVLRQAAEHARERHGLAQVDEATAKKVKAAIRER